MNKTNPFDLNKAPTSLALAKDGKYPVIPTQLVEMPLICRLIRAYPKTYRDSPLTHYDAYVFHGHTSIRVKWATSQCDSRLKQNALVAVQGLAQIPNKPDVFQISRLEVLDHPVPELNLFNTIPAYWVNDRELIWQAARLMDALPGDYRHFFNAIFWDQKRFQRYCIGPSSMNHHHNYINGNLIHSVEVAFNVFQACLPRPTASPALGILAALLHDAGKADEYIQLGNGKFKLSTQGKLLGHKNTVTQWIAQAKVLWNIPMRDDDYLALQHCLNSAPNAPAWTEIRRPVMEEAFLLSGFDRMSGQQDLFQRCVSKAAGWSNYSESFKGRVFRVERFPAYDPGYGNQVGCDTQQLTYRVN
jgi:3'-5' exoribonuclease